jgi:hypothetical protein
VALFVWCLPAPPKALPGVIAGQNFGKGKGVPDINITNKIAETDTHVPSAYELSFLHVVSIPCIYTEIQFVAYTSSIKKYV